MKQGVVLNSRLRCRCIQVLGGLSKFRSQPDTLTVVFFPFIRMQPTFDYVITVCDESTGQNCPDFPRTTTKLQWSFPDPAAFTGTDEEKLARTREVRDAIKARIEAWCAEICVRAAA